MTIVIAGWFCCWCWRFLQDWRAGQNGATFALWVFFGVMAIERILESLGFFYLVSPWVTPILSSIILQLREFIILVILLALAILQWRFTGGKDTNENDN